MEIILLLCKKILRAHKSLWIPIVLLLALLIAITVSTFEMPYAFRESQIAFGRDVYGEQDAIVFDISKISDIESKELGKMGYFYIYGILNLNVQTYRNAPLIGNADENAISLNHIRLREGTLPRENNEIAVERWVLSFFDEDVKIGDSLNLTYNLQDAEGEFSKEIRSEYILVGILENYAFIHVPSTGSDNFANKMNKLPNILTATKKENSIVHASFSLAKTSESFLEYSSSIKTKINELWASSEYNGFYINSKKYDIEQEANLTKEGSNQILSYIAGLMVVVTITAAAILMVLLTSKIGHSRKVLMKIGTPRKILIAFSFSFLMVLAFISSILGYILSFPISALVSKLISRAFSLSYSMYFSYLNSFLALILVILIFAILSFAISTLSSREKLYGKDIRIIPRFKHKLGKSPAKLLLSRDIAQNLSKYIISSFAIGISIFCVSISYAFIKDTELSNKTLQENDISIFPTLTFSATELRIPMDKDNGATKEALDILENSRYIKNMVAIKEVNFNLLFDEKEKESLLEKLFKTARCIPFYSLQSFEETLINYGYSKEDRLYTIKLIEYENDIIDGINKLTSAKDVILFIPEDYYVKDYESLVGSKIVLTQIFDQKERKDFDFNIACIIVVKPNTDNLNNIISSQSPHFAVSNGTLKDLNLEDLYTSIYIDLKDPDDETSFVPYLDMFIHEAPSMRIQSNAQINAERARERNAVILVAIVIGLPCIVISLMVIWVIHTNKLKSRVDLYRRLNCMGMTKQYLHYTFLLDYLAHVPLAYVFYMLIMWLFADEMKSVFLHLTKAHLFMFVVLLLFCIPLIIYHKRFLKTISSS